MTTVTSVAADHGCADAAVAVSRDHLDPRIGGRSLVGVRQRVVSRGVVDDDDPVDERGDAVQRRREERLLIVRGDHDCDALVLHQSGGQRIA
jgi:hypothetical protein